METETLLVKNQLTTMSAPSSFDSCCKKDNSTNGGDQQQLFVTQTTGYKTPLDAFYNGKREEIVYLTAINTNPHKHSDAIITVDVDPNSKTYSQVIHVLEMPYLNDELHHFGWNACSSCYEKQNQSGDKRKYLFVPGVKSNRFYAVDVKTNQRAPKLAKVVDPEEIKKKTELTYPHTAHCLGNGNVMVSMMGDKEGNGGCGFLLFNQNFELTSEWHQSTDEAHKNLKYGYDFWYQPYHNIMVSTEWGSPSAFTKGFDPKLVDSHYGRSINFWNWNDKKLLKRVDLGDKGLIPLEVRFLHNPKSAHGFVACALSSTVFHFYKKDDDWQVEQVIEIPPIEVEGWALPHMPSLITDFVISLDDKYLYLANWLHGDVRQYDISNPSKPKLVGQVFIGGSLKKGGSVSIKDSGHTNGKIESTNSLGNPNQLVEPLVVKGIEVQGGAQMIQLSLDGKRLYVTNSLFSDWDLQFYPKLREKGSQLVMIDVDIEKGGLKVNDNFIVDFGVSNKDSLPNGPYNVHEIRYPGGDCTSDIWLA
ncbi:hypothetical protein ABK040_001707 [Willaertia magna]